MASVPATWAWRRKPRVILNATKQRDVLRTLKHSHPEHWDRLCAGISQTVALQNHTVETLANLQPVLLDQLRNVPQPSGSSTGLPAESLVRQMWTKHRQYLAQKPMTQFHLFQKWRLWTQLRSMRKTLRRTSRLYKKEKIEERIQEACQAFRQHDAYKMYRVIRALAPKTPFQQAHLRSSFGLAQNPEAELAEIAGFFRQLCNGPCWSHSAQALPAMPFTEEELAHALARTPSTKSVAPQTLPGIVVSSIAPNLASWKNAQLQTLWLESPTLDIPSGWRDAWVICLPKRSVKTPRDLRPIALQCPIGKAVLRVITKKASQQVHSMLTPRSIFAYLPGRSTEHALLRVHAHLHQVRDCCLFQTRTVWSRHAGLVEHTCRGGLTFSLDLSNAFDTARDHLADGMKHVALSKPLQDLLLSWLNDVSYHVQHKGHCETIPVTRGIRQGCVASPFLWLMWTMSFLQQLVEARDPEWIKQHLNLYADDVVGQWFLQSIADFEASLRDLGLLLDVLEAMQLQVSMTKSMILLRFSGSARKALMKKHSCRIDGKCYLRVPRANGSVTLLPIVTKRKYLGTILTYHNPEESTLTYRLQCGKLAFTRLLRFLGRSCNLTFAFKYRIWKQCVYTSYVYGLFATGLTSHGCVRFARRVFTDLRRMSGKWSFLTHVSNSDLCDQLCVPLPLDELQERWHEHAAKHAGQLSALAPNDFLHRVDVAAHWQSQFLVIAEASHDQVKPLHSQNLNVWPCPHCDRSFTTHAVMRRHVTTQHDELTVYPQFKPERDSLNGLPQCSHCLVKLTTKTNLRWHIEKQWCPAFRADAMQAQTLCQRADLKALITQRDWVALFANRELCDQLKNQCCLCNQWCAQMRGLAIHLRKEHAEHFAPSLPNRPEIARWLRIGVRCEGCQQEVPNGHICPVVAQAAVLMYYHRDEPASQDGPEPSATPPSGHKRKSPWDGPDTTPPGPEEIPFDACRDCRGGRNICNHCGVAYADHISLRRHISRAKCPRFNRDLPPQPWIIRYQAPILEAFCLQQPEHWLQDRDFLARLRNECVLCGRHFDSGRAVVKHLSQEHMQALNKAQPYATHLHEHFQPHGAACLCGAWQLSGGNHPCPVTSQLSILRHLAQQELPPPGTGVIPRLLDQWLADEDFDRAWEHPELAYIFGNYCGLCLNRIHDLDNLWRHFEEFHETMLPPVLRRYDRIMQDRMTCCVACRNLPPETRSQAPKCPFAINSLLLCHLRHGLASHGSERDGRPPRTPRRLRPPSRGIFTSLKEEEASGNDLQHLCQQMCRLMLRQEDTLNALAMDTNWLIFLDRRQRGVIGHVLEATKKWHTAHKKGEVTHPLRVQVCASLFQEMHARMVKISAAKPGDPVWQGAVQSYLITDDMPQSSHRPDHPMEAAHQPTERRLFDAAPGSPTGQRSLAVHTMHKQTMGPTSLNFSAADRTKYAGGLPREALQTAVMGLRLKNPRNQCWSNATVCCWLWATTSVKDLQWTDFGA